jgi:hypothetical protein
MFSNMSLNILTGIIGLFTVKTFLKPKPFENENICLTEFVNVELVWDDYDD